MDAVSALYAAEFDSLPVGTLNRRTSDDFARILSSPGGASMGAFTDGRLVGYTLCDVGPFPAAAEPFALAGLLPQGEPVGQVFGTLIYPEFKGHALGARMIRARRGALLAKGIHHAMGTMLTDNFSSIITYLRCGSVLCGFEYDPYGLLNFAHYSGTLADRAPAEPPIRTSEVAEMRALFARGYVCRSLAWDRTRSTPRPVYTMTGEFAGST